MFGYMPPVEVIFGEMKTEFEDNVMRAVQSYDINVDKDELVRALNYDRNQYQRGFDFAVSLLKDELEDFSNWCKDGRKEGVDFVLDCVIPNLGEPINELNKIVFNDSSSEPAKEERPHNVF